MPDLKIAVVGAGAAGMYAVQHLLEQTAHDVRIDLIESLPTPWGLVRAGVAPDHPEKKQIGDRLFSFYVNDDRVRLLGNVEVGADISHRELAPYYHAVIYAVGASDDRALGIPGEELPGSWSARQFVAWYNGHPAYRELQFDLSASRAVIVGNGNVAIDVARILTLPVSELARTDIAEHALEALRNSRIRDVVILGRRGCREAAFHNPEIEELLHLDTVEVRIDGDNPVLAARSGCDWETRRKLETLARLQARHVTAPEKRMTFRFYHVPLSVKGDGRVSALDVQVNGSVPAKRSLPCGLLLRAIGYRGSPLPGLPFDEGQGVISNREGRVVDGAQPIAGVYVTGWIKRGPRGVIGSNKQCAAETVASLLADADTGKLVPPVHGDIAALLGDRGCEIVPRLGWHRIDAAERRAGHAQGRPRVKLTRTDDLLAEAVRAVSRGET